MFGGIIGDIVGSVYEDGNMNCKKFPLWSAGCRYTDDTVLTVATADCILNNGSYEDYYYKYATEYPTCGYGSGFMKRVFIKKFHNKYIPYNSYGNGSAMRVSPIGWAYDHLEDVLQKSKESSECTHNHIEGIKGAQAIACCVFLARKYKTKDYIRCFIEDTFHYNLSISLEELTRGYLWNATCQQTVPQAIISFLQSKNFEDCIRNAISLGGDSDTIACMAGAVAEAFYGIPTGLRDKALELIPPTFVNIVNQFEKRFGNIRVV